MSIKKLLAAAALVAIAAPAVAQTISVTQDECERVGGSVNEDDGVCLLTPAQAANLQTTAAVDATGLGGGLSGGAAVGLGLLVVLAAASGSSSTTTTTTSP